MTHRMIVLRNVNCLALSTSRSLSLNVLLAFPLPTSVLLLVVAFLAHNGYLQVPQLESISMDTLVLVILSMVILIPRMISGR